MPPRSRCTKLRTDSVCSESSCSASESSCSDRCDRFVWSPPLPWAVLCDGFLWIPSWEEFAPCNNDAKFADCCIIGDNEYGLPQTIIRPSLMKEIAESAEREWQAGWEDSLPPPHPKLWLTTGLADMSDSSSDEEPPLKRRRISMMIFGGCAKCGA